MKLIDAHELKKKLFFDDAGNKYHFRDVDNFPINISMEELESIINSVPEVKPESWTPLTPYTFPPYNKSVEVLLDNGDICFAYCREGRSDWFSGGMLLTRSVRFWRNYIEKVN